jgi:hypothetical protein
VKSNNTDGASDVLDNQKTLIIAGAILMLVLTAMMMFSRK